MKKFKLLATIMLFVLATSCQKDDVLNDTSIDILEAAKKLPHYNDSNSELIAWENFPDELKNAEQIGGNQTQNKAYSYADGPYGGGGGSAFNFNPSTTDRIHSIAMNTGRVVDKIIVYYIKPDGSIYTGLNQGGNGGSYYIQFFQTNEYIKNVSGKSGSKLDRLTIITNKKSFTYGGNGGSSFNISIPPSGFHVLGFFGRSGSKIDNIGFYIHTL